MENQSFDSTSRYKEGTPASARFGSGGPAYHAAPPPFADAYWETAADEHRPGWRLITATILIFLAGAAAGIAGAWWLDWPGGPSPVQQTEAAIPSSATAAGARPAVPLPGLPAAELPYDGAPEAEQGTLPRIPYSLPAGSGLSEQAQQEDAGSGNSLPVAGAAGRGSATLDASGDGASTASKTGTDAEEGAADGANAEDRQAAAPRKGAGDIAGKAGDKGGARSAAAPTEPPRKAVKAAVAQRRTPSAVQPASTGSSAAGARAAGAPASSELERMRQQAAAEQRRAQRERLLEMDITPAPAESIPSAVR